MNIVLLPRTPLNLSKYPATSIDIASTSKIVKVGIILCSLDVSKLLKDIACIPIAERFSCLFHKPNDFHPCEDVDQGNAWEVFVRTGASTTSLVTIARPPKSTAGGPLVEKTHGDGGPTMNILNNEFQSVRCVVIYFVLQLLKSGLCGGCKVLVNEYSYGVTFSISF